MNPQRILVTGSAGRVGRAVVAELVVRGHAVNGFDVRPTPGIPTERSVVGTLADSMALRDAARGVQAIIHLAATPDDARFPRGAPTDDGDNFVSELVPNNVIGPYQVLEAARVNKVPRVILASSGQVVDGYERDGLIPVPAGVAPRPRYLYACTKAFLEALGQVYARQHGIAVLAVRLGWCPRDAKQVEEIRRDERGQDVYFSPGDAGRFFAAAVEAEKLPPFAVLSATSRFTHRLRYDLSLTRELLGWEPRDQWPEGVERQ
jgi:nucleoside-diphosphate-sugar epimerase